MNKLTQSKGNVYATKCKDGNIKNRVKRSIVSGYGIACLFKCHHNVISAKINEVFATFWTLSSVAR